jgi:hypothetical protein
MAGSGVDQCAARESLECLAPRGNSAGPLATEAARLSQWPASPKLNIAVTWRNLANGAKRSCGRHLSNRSNRRGLPAP